MNSTNKTYREAYYWAYANLAMGHIAYKDSAKEYSRKHFGIRKKIFSDLMSGQINIRSIFDDEKAKIAHSNVCSYCGSKDNIATDHLIPRNRGGKDSGDNLIAACRSCNSSKSDQDLLTWLRSKNKYPSILVYRRYLKLAIVYCHENNLMDELINSPTNTPFDVTSLFEKELDLSSLILSSSDFSLEANKTEVTNVFRIANWNLEKAKKGLKLNRALDQILLLDPAIIGLTELTTDVNLPNFKYALFTKPFKPESPDLTAGIFSKWPIIKSIDTYEPTQAICALIDSPLGHLIIYVCIIPYHMAGVRGGKYGNLGYKAWQMHEEHIEYLNQDWQRIQAKYKEIPLIAMGDFNQVRDSKAGGYGPQKCREKLTNALENNTLNCLTEVDFEDLGFLSPDPTSGTTRRNIDHICISSDQVSNISHIDVGAWNHFNDKGQRMSDHNGTYIDLFSIT
ncbi:MAG: HNH endonuclease [Gammaproteobacteria bacterium]|nr:HNH endonuclease [Gammaproteobacteria bacterium]